MPSGRPGRSPSPAGRAPTRPLQDNGQPAQRIPRPERFTGMNDTILSMRGITKTFPGVKALSDVNLEVKRGEIHSICGENGAGKSTLMKVLSGVYPYGTYDGDIFFDGAEVRFKNIPESEAAGIAIIHQELALIPAL